MLFNSFEFFVFLSVALLIYWKLPSMNLRNGFLLITGYFFYAWWDYRFLSLIFISSVSDYYISQWIYKSRTASVGKKLLWLSLIINLGILGFFKYFNFFIESLVALFARFQWNLDINTLNIVLPVGISFYTFQTMSYTIDVYRGKLKPCENLTVFLTYVSFFPQLVAGPIERAARLLPQFQTLKKNYAEDWKEGFRQILWGLFKKMAIADQCGYFVDDIFLNYQEYSPLILMVGILLFAFQIYGDFSGYSDMAIGMARLFGFQLTRNFAYPYFSLNIPDFWRRWHITLSTWFRDYLYIPMGGSRVNKTWMLVRNVLVVFLVSGFWHGANWTFIFWGLLNGLYFLPSVLIKTHKKYVQVVAQGKVFPSLKELGAMLFTFMLINLSWVFFRAENLEHAFSYFGYMFRIDFRLLDPSQMVRLGMVSINILLLLILEWNARSKSYPLQGTSAKLVFRWSYYLVIGVLTLMNSSSKESFIYFQF